MIPLHARFNRRRFMNQVAAGTAAVLTPAFFTTPGLFADELTRTPKQTEGPFYPTKLPLDTDNDLIIINDSLTPAVGMITHLTGRILDATGAPIRNAGVEIWQCDGHGVYLHPGSGNGDQRDPNFQGFGRFVTGSTGEYYFRTIKPVKYPGRSPHIHFKIRRSGKDLLTTQCYIKGDPSNDKDGVYRGIRDPKARDSVTIAFDPLKGSRVKELAANF